MNENKKGEYQIQLVTGDVVKILGVFESKEDAYKYGKKVAPDYPRAKGLVCCIWRQKGSTAYRFFDIFN